MRRKDREVTNQDKIKEIISSCTICRLGFYDKGEVYLVPLNFGYEEKNGRRLFYFHSAKEGRKIDCIVHTHRASFELDTGYCLVEGEKACQCTARFQSIFGTGNITFLEQQEEKKNALQAILLHCTGKHIWDFSKSMLDSVCVFQLTVESLSCKEHT